ncbi:hypothetical protein EHQ81_18830 [Leptospira selangorensis]|uniref:Uncharacterized protein n=1 Tax=Leptospira selangorensis TaxID=2484982 RepID=A0A5F2BVA7_9LEPT|nr:hypothetical protein [Leptospira selangorensis]TGM10683.1 hypothetical protein EHQ81_18830 [Leptospira selangorensis]TGM11014.1 hypothetical protein EHQ82_21350 [Leptospira selangorensis]
MSKKEERLSLPNEYSDIDKIDQVKFLATDVLTREKKDSPEKAISGSELVELINQYYPDHGVNTNTLWQYLSVLANSSDNPINKPGRNKGFYVLSKTESKAGLGIEPEQEDESHRIQREKLLYPIFSQWLLGKGVKRIKDTSSGRNQDLGTWGNPDITGIIIREVMGNLQDIEINTLEIKTSISNWKYSIFEAVAHKRFSNRSYYCFAHPENLIPKIDDDLRYYAEIYDIGILILPLEDKIYKKLTSEKGSEINSNVLTEYSATDIIEYFSAKKDNTHLHFRDRFLKALNINTEGELREWGVLR